MTYPVRPFDISGNEFPLEYGTPGGGGNGGGGGGFPSTVINYRPPQFEPPPTAREFIVGFSVIAAANATTALFTLDANGNPNVPSAALALGSGQIARISGISIGGDTGASAGGVTLTFFLSNTRDGTQRLPGLDAIPLPSRGGIVSVGFDMFTVIDNPGSFFGGFVASTDPAPRYADMLIQGWYW